VVSAKVRLGIEAGFQRLGPAIVGVSPRGPYCNQRRYDSVKVQTSQQK